MTSEFGAAGAKEPEQQSANAAARSVGRLATHEPTHMALAIGMALGALAFGAVMISMVRPSDPPAQSNAKTLETADLPPSAQWSATERAEALGSKPIAAPSNACCGVSPYLSADGPVVSWEAPKATAITRGAANDQKEKSPNSGL